MTLDELDKLAAEKVMGWEINEHPKNAYPAYWGRDTSARWITDWQPTRNISQAWECLEKFKEFRIDQEEGPEFMNVIIWFNGDMHYGYGDGIPEAIVRACLAAKGVEV